MIKCQIVAKNLPQIQQRYQKKASNSQQLVKQISLRTGIEAIQQLRINAPKFTGYLATNIVGRLVLFKYLSRYWITFPVDWAWYANYGRPAVSVRNKKSLRWWASGQNKLGTGGKIFRRSSGATGTFAGDTRFRTTGNMVMFIENTTMTISPKLVMIAEQELMKFANM